MVDVRCHGQDKHPPLNLDQHLKQHLTRVQLERTQVSEKVWFVENLLPMELQPVFLQPGVEVQMSELFGRDL